MFPRENDTQFTMACLCFRIENTCTKTRQISLILVVFHKQRVRSMMQERKKQDGIGLPGETNAILQGGRNPMEYGPIILPSGVSC